MDKKKAQTVDVTGIFVQYNPERSTMKKYEIYKIFRGTDKQLWTLELIERSALRVAQQLADQYGVELIVGDIKK